MIDCYYNLADYYKDNFHILNNAAQQAYQMLALPKLISLVYNTLIRAEKKECRIYILIQVHNKYKMNKCSRLFLH